MEKTVILDCILHRGDCLEMLETVVPNSVAAAIVDPPYGIGFVPNSRKILAIPEMLANDETPHLEFVPPIVRAVKDGGAIYLCTRFDVAQPWVDALTETGAKVKNPIFWIKDSVGLGDLTGDRGNAVEIVLFATVGRHLLRGKRTANAWPIARAEPTLHPTTKPVELMRRCILASSDPGDLILDPFSGSGSTAVACVLTGRRFIGAEMHGPYFDLACDRIKTTYRDVDSRLPGFEPVAMEQGSLFD